MRVEVTVKIRKGLGPETLTKIFVIILDADPDKITARELIARAKAEMDSLLRKSEDYKHYGKNWEILGVYPK